MEKGKNNNSDGVLIIDEEYKNDKYNGTGI